MDSEAFYVACHNPMTIRSHPQPATRNLQPVKLSQEHPKTLPGSSHNSTRIIPKLPFWLNRSLFLYMCYVLLGGVLFGKLVVLLALLLFVLIVAVHFLLLVVVIFIIFILLFIVLLDSIAMPPW